MGADDLEKIAQEHTRWAAAFKTDASPPVETDLGISTKAVYTPADLSDLDYLNDLGFPGQFPYTRGPYPEMSRHKPWRYSIFTGFDTPEDTNRRWKFLHQSGQPSFSIVYDTPTHQGVDSDEPLAEDEVGRVGIPIDTARDIEILFADLPLGAAPFYSNMETLAAMIVAMYIAAGEKRGVAHSTLMGSISNDPLATAVSKGTTVFPIEHGVRLAVDLVEFCTREMPRFYPVNLKGVNLSEGGASMAQEVGFSFANAVCLIEQALARGLEIDQFAPGFTFFFSTTPHLFEEVAKYRAARRIWARLLAQRFGAQRRGSLALKFTALACPLWLQVEEPELNLVRAAVAALGSALGGAQAMPHPGFDEAYAIPTEKSQSLALGTQQILAEETNITKVVDPLGGSYYVEHLTNQLEQHILRKMQEVEDLGGAMRAINGGYMQRDILNYYYRVQCDIENGTRVIVRRNKYRVVERQDPWEKLTLHKPNAAAIHRHIDRLKQIKRERDNAAVARCLDRLQRAARGTENLMPCLIDAARAYASIGEMTATLKDVWGEYKEPPVL